MEILVARYILGGYCDKETARLLRLSFRTIHTHRLNARKSWAYKPGGISLWQRVSAEYRRCDMTNLKALSDAASPGPLFVTENYEQAYAGESPEPRLIHEDEEPTCTLTLNPDFTGWCTDSGNENYCIGRRNAEFLAALWNAYREGRLIEKE